MSTRSIAQCINCTVETRAKGKRLIVTTITRHMAFVEGDTDVYQVDLVSLRCTCKAGQYGLRCSHVQAAIRERAAMAGRTVMFAHSDTHAESWAALQRSRGHTATTHQQYGYIWTEVTPAPTLPAPQAPQVTVLTFRPRKTAVEIQAEADELVA